MSIHSFDLHADRLEKTYNLKGIESTEKGLGYFFDGEGKGVLVMTSRDGKAHYVGLNKKQAYALVDEFKDICDMVFGGRGDEPTNN
jgi:hypothetical protein